MGAIMSLCLGLVWSDAALSANTSPAASAARVAAVSSDQRPWSWPTGGPVAVSRAFDPPDQPWLSGHRGVDLDVPVGAVVVSPADGVVVYAGLVADREVVSVEIDGVRATFEPVSPRVRRGDRVVRGQELGVVLPGHVPGGLHWGVRVDRKSYVNPLGFLSSRVVLKPWDG
ncbi:MAG: peptidoglycan DD-metalloendopeptidase family protein [Actinomycetaceae bacterium]|nr:peptidoglycan DD-metalloendopeptidase family protein [Actinomycetaceae bacterium]